MTTATRPRGSRSSALGLGATVAGVLAVVGGLAFYATRDTGPSNLVISEVVASNSATFADAEGDHEDWIELHNPTDEVVDLTGWVLSDDDEPTVGWVFPEETIEPGGHLVVFASGLDHRDAQGRLHTNFRIDRLATIHIERSTSPGAMPVAHASSRPG